MIGDCTVDGVSGDAATGKHRGLGEAPGVQRGAKARLTIALCRAFMVQRNFDAPLGKDHPNSAAGAKMVLEFLEGNIEDRNLAVIAGFARNLAGAVA